MFSGTVAKDLADIKFKFNKLKNKYYNKLIIFDLIFSHSVSRML